MNKVEFIKDSIKDATGEEVSTKVASYICELTYTLRLFNRSEDVTRKNIRQSKNLTIASRLYRDELIVGWKAEIAKVYKTNQTYYTDRLVPYYRAVMESMTTAQRKVMIRVLLSYHKGVTQTEIATTTFMNTNVVNTLLYRLQTIGFIKKDGTWKCKDQDWLRVTAMRWDDAFSSFWNEHRTDPDLANIVDVFIDQR